MDSKIRILKQFNKKFDPFMILDGSDSSIYSLDVNPMDSRFVCAGNYDQSLLLWKLPI